MSNGDYRRQEEYELIYRGIKNTQDLYPAASQYRTDLYGACPMYVKHLKGFEDAYRWWKTLNWDNPNPYDVRYLIALQWAYLERFGQGHITSYNIADKGVIIDNFAKFFFDSDQLQTNGYTYQIEDMYFYASVEDIIETLNVNPNVFNVGNFPYYSLNKKWKETTYYNRNGIVKYNEFKNLDFPGLQTYIKALYSFFKNATLYYAEGPYRTGRFGTGFVKRIDIDRCVSPVFFYGYDKPSYTFDIKNRVCKNIKKQVVHGYQRANKGTTIPEFHQSTRDAILCSYYYDKDHQPHDNYGYDSEPVSSNGIAWADLSGVNFRHNGDYFVTSLDRCLFMFDRKFYFTSPLIGEPIVIGSNPLEEREKKRRIKTPISIASDGMSCEILWEQMDGWKEMFDNKEFSINKLMNLPGVLRIGAEVLNTGKNIETYSFEAFEDPDIFVDLTKGVIPLSFI
jgi:hypothetical protein